MSQRSSNNKREILADLSRVSLYEMKSESQISNTIVNRAKVSHLSKKNRIDLCGIIYIESPFYRIVIADVHLNGKVSGPEKRHVTKIKDL